MNLTEGSDGFFLPVLTFIVKLVLGFVVICQWNASIAQGGFNNTYDFGRSCRTYSVAYSPDHYIYMTGVMFDLNSSDQQLYLSRLDTLGNVINLSIISDPDSNHLVVNPESGMLLTSKCQKTVLPFVSSGKSAFGMVILDSLGGIESFQKYHPIDTGVTTPTDIIEVFDGYYVLGWISEPPLYLTNAFILRSDLNGNFLWFKEYGHSIYEESPRTLTFVDANCIVMSGVRYQVNNEPNFFHGWALAIDSLGNEKWEWEASEMEIPSRGIMSMQFDTLNKEWVYVTDIKRRTTYPGKDYDVRVPLLVFRDSAMNLISYQEYGPYAINHYMGALEQDKSSGWVAAGSYTTTTDEYVSPIQTQSGRVLKLAHNGDLEWSVIDTAFYHDELGSRSYLSGVTTSPTGSVYAVGWANNYDEQHVYRSFGWLLKITSEGCVDTLCTTTSLIEQMQDRLQKIKVYPNPAADYATFELSEEIHEEMHIELYDITGALKQTLMIQQGTHEVLLDSDSYVPGIYLWRGIDRQGRLVQSGKLMFLGF